jgi:3-oxoadipate enol-lactonase
MEIEVNGASIHCVVEGAEDAPWVTLSHSIAADHSFWGAQVRALSGRFRILNYDTRGHGKSTVGDAPYSLELLAADVVALWDHLGIARSHFVGLSLGGMTGLVLGFDHPGRVDRLVIANARTESNDDFKALWDQRMALAEADGMAPIAEASLARWFTGDFIAREPDQLAHVRAVIESCPVDGFTGAAAAIRDIDLHRKLGGLQCPTLFIAGAEDGACPPADVRADQRAVASSSYMELSPAAHISNLEQPDDFNDALIGFLEE